MPQLTYWLHLPQELNQMKASFQQVFEMEKLTHEYDQTWEWITGKSDWPPAQITIFRLQNGRKGRYDQPLIIRITFSTPETIEAPVIEKIGVRIQQKFETEVCFGKILVTQGEERNYVVEKRFSG